MAAGSELSFCPSNVSGKRNGRPPNAVKEAFNMDYRIKLYRSAGDFETASEKYIEKRVLKKSEKNLGLFLTVEF